MAPIKEKRRSNLPFFLCVGMDRDLPTGLSTVPDEEIPIDGN
jgi:hypothetical protein